MFKKKKKEKKNAEGNSVQGLKAFLGGGGQEDPPGCAGHWEIPL